MSAITETNFSMLRLLNKEYTPEHRGFASKEEVDKIVGYLAIDKRDDIIDLRNLRDFAVMFFGHLDENKKPEDTKDYYDMMSAVTAVIDNRIFALGGEV